MTTRVRLETSPGRTVTVDPNAARVVLDAGGYGCYGEASEFERCLAVAILKADDDNRGRLRLGYPQLVDAVDVLDYAQDGLAALKAAIQQPTSRHADSDPADAGDGMG